MANDSSNNQDRQKVEVNGTTGMNSTAQNDITLALLQNGGIQRIQATLQQRLDAAGWSQDLKEYTTRLLRSGTASTYPEIWDIVMKNIHSNGASAVETADGTPAPDLTIPREAAVDAAEVVKKELAQIVKPKK